MKHPFTNPNAYDEDDPMNQEPAEQEPRFDFDISYFEYFVKTEMQELLDGHHPDELCPKSLPVILIEGIIERLMNEEVPEAVSLMVD